MSEALGGFCDYPDDRQSGDSLGGAGQQGAMLVPINSLLPGDSPRLEGENHDHAKVLAESTARLPPILVHRASMRVIDGVHRLHAAVLRGQGEIEVRYFDGDHEEAFVRAVEENNAHGLPLTLADRKAAAVRVIRAQPQRSDRSIARIVGLSPKTVSATRRRLAEELPHSNTRIGRDGLIRPVSNAAGRIRASALIESDPDASLREIAAAAGIATSTAHDVRTRMKSGQDPVKPRRHGNATSVRRRTRREQPRRMAEPGSVDLTSAIHALRSDPAIRFTDAGRVLIRYCDAHRALAEVREQLIENIPAHRTDLIANLARTYAEDWREFADRLA
jgi:DNA-binding CsgD family transcriptional regulator